MKAATALTMLAVLLLVTIQLPRGGRRKDTPHESGQSRRHRARVRGPGGR